MKKVDIKEITKNLNTARMVAGNHQFKTRKEFQDFLKCYDVKVGNYVLLSKLYSAMCKDGKLLPNPIHIDKVKAIYEYVRTYKNKHIKKEENQPEKKEEKDLITIAIELLKKNGYKVLKPVTEYKEV